MTSPFSDLFYSAPDGLKLHARIYGDTIHSGLPVVCLPGLSRNARDFHELALNLSKRTERPRRVIVFDYRGRGLSSYDRNWRNYNVVVEADDVIAGLIAAGVEKAHFIGTSRGGLIIHRLGVVRPTVFGSIVLNDIGPVIEGEGLAQIRSYLERAPRPADMAAAVAIQRAAHGAAFPALTEADWQRFAGAIYREEKGRPVADFDPALLKTLKQFDLDKPIPAIWHLFEALAGFPMLVIRGANSKLLSAAPLAEMAHRHPDCRTITVEGQGHAPLLETGDLPAVIAGFCDEIEDRE
ncbi:alpha/beta hydrolase [Mesorhizobium sp. VNQ89]|uniref:alpha/beta fold hydrolase n=1 Tax=Mesorhizobium quangtriensis TaxID=3157709 RepID=UPI0032B7DA2B